MGFLSHYAHTKKWETSGSFSSQTNNSDLALQFQLEQDSTSVGYHPRRHRRRNFRINYEDFIDPDAEWEEWESWALDNADDYALECDAYAELQDAFIAGAHENRKQQ